MMKNFNKVLLLGIAIIFTCCNSYFDEYYEDKRTIEASSVLEYLNSSNEYSAFVECLVETGLDSTLEEAKTITVFAVENEGMDYIKNLSVDSMLLYMKYHLAYGNNYRSELQYKSRLKSFNGKYHAITNNGEIRINNVTFNMPDVTCGNGIIQGMNSSFSVKRNLYETILRLPDEFSIIRNYISDADTLLFDRGNSKPIGINETGNTIYDTVWIHSNRILQGTGDVRKEDDFFTAFIPTNDAVTSAITNVRKSYKNATGKDFKPEVDLLLFKWCHEALFYIGEVEDVKADTMLTLTNGSKFLLSVQQVDENSKKPTSNGDLYAVTDLKVPKFKYMEEVKITPRYIMRMDAATRDLYRTIEGGYEHLDPAIGGWYNLYVLIGGVGHWSSFKTFFYDENDELKDVAIIPGEYDIYVKSSTLDYGINEGSGIQKLYLNDMVLGQGEYPAYDHIGSTGAGYYLGRNLFPNEWGVNQADLKIEFVANYGEREGFMTMDWVKFVPTKNNY